MMNESRGKHICRVLVRNGFVNSFSHLFNIFLLSTYYMLDFALEMVRLEGWTMDSLNDRTITWKMFMLSCGIIFRIKKIVYKECSVNHYTLS